MVTKARSQRLAVLLGATALAAWATPALAQDAPIAVAPVTAEDLGQENADIVVRALLREDTLQDTPAAVTAFTADAIESAGIDKPADFISLTSNVSLVETQNAGNAFVIIRGITQARNSEPSVAVVIDGVQQVNAAQFNQELFDIEQIEVLKGPQGGLYGRNAIGGAIIITTKQPGDEFEAQFRAGIDNGFGYRLGGSVSGPITDTLKARAAINWRDTEGYIPNVFLGEDADPVENLSARGSFLFEPNDNLTIDLRGSVDFLRTQALYFNIVTDVNDTSLPVRVNNAGQNDRDMANVSLRIEYADDAAVFTSVTSYDTLTEVLTGDAFDFLPIEESLFYNILGFDMNQSQFLDVKAWSQEVRLASPGGGALDWMVGAYAISTERYISTGNMVDTGNGAFPVYRTPSTNPLNPQATFLADSQNNFAWAVFANATYRFSDQFRIDGSLRYDRDTRRNTTLTPTAFLPNIVGFPPGRTGEVRKAVFDEWQPKVTATFEPSDSVTAYASYSKGFRSGGFNQTGVGGVAFANGIVGVEDVFEAETAETFEGGLKFQTPDRRLSANFAAYTTTSKNSYFFVFLAANSTQNLGNVPEVELQGFEIDATARPLPGLDLNAAFGMTFSDIKEFPDPVVIGNEAPLISRYTLNLGAQYKPDTGGPFSPLLRIDYRLTGKTWWDVYNTTVRKPVGIVDVRAGVESDTWSLTAFAQNLFDKKYNAEFSPGGFVFKARPLIYGLEAMVRF